MAQNITSYISNGLFEAGKINLEYLNESGTTASISTDLSGCKDSVIAIVDIPTSSDGSHSFVFKSADGGKDIKVDLVPNKTNVIRFTTKGIKGKDGIGNFEFITDNGMGISNLAVKVGFIKCVDVVNH